MPSMQILRLVQILHVVDLPVEYLANSRSYVFHCFALFFGSWHLSCLTV